MNTHETMMAFFHWYMDDFYERHNEFLKQLKDPEYLFIDSDGNGTNSLINGSTRNMNAFHPEYIEYLRTVDMVDRKQANILAAQLQELSNELRVG